MNTANLSPAITFLLFTVASFLMLRYVLANFAREDRAKFAAPILIFAGAVSGMLFFRLQLGQYYIWFAMIFALIIFRWHAQSKMDDKKILDMAGQAAGKAKHGKPTMKNAAGDPEIVQMYTMTRRLLSFALVSYLAAFSAVFYYLFSTAG
jgi:hypothetical protein